jgi:citrate lyase beta subunit
LPQRDTRDIERLIEQYELKRLDLVSESGKFRARLPLKYLRQYAHYTAPASNYDMLEKAIERGAMPASRILEKYEITSRDLSDSIELPVSIIDDGLNSENLLAPLVLVDGEDAQALKEDVVVTGRGNAIRAFNEIDRKNVLRFYRPSGLNLEYSVRDLFTVLTSVSGNERYPVDGIVLPKVEHPSEIRFVCDILGEIEGLVDLDENSIKLEFLVESGWGLAQLPELVMECLPRLAGIIWGIADYSSDVGIPEIVNDHPVADWARSFIINMAGASGVPAIDAMTMNYPVADLSMSDSDIRFMILSRLTEIYEHALHGINLGMDGKWVGHPLQLFMVKLAYDQAFDEEEINAEIERIEAYNRSVESNVGATMIDGVMTDRATDRHTRSKIRKAIAIGKVDPDIGLNLNLISAEEHIELKNY